MSQDWDLEVLGLLRLIEKKKIKGFERYRFRRED